MSIRQLIEKVRIEASIWNEELEDQATLTDLLPFKALFLSKYGFEVPRGYLAFLSVVNGLEFNGLIIYGIGSRKEAESSCVPSLLDINEDRQNLKDQTHYQSIKLGEDSTGIYTYNGKKMVFEYRDHFSASMIASFSSLEEMLAIAIEAAFD